MQESGIIQPVIKTVRLPLDCQGAFELFVDGMDSWWPLVSHSVLGPAATGVRVEPRLGGAVVEMGADGPAHTWATITEWDPPHRVSFNWHPGQDPSEATNLELTFEPVEGGSQLRLVHDGWEHRANAQHWRTNYDAGWDVVLAPLAAMFSDD